MWLHLTRRGDEARYTSPMTVTLLLFASYRDSVGAKSLELNVSEGTTVRELAEGLGRDYSTSFSGALCAVNERYVPPDTPIKPGDTVALFPPVAGGSGADHFFVTEEAIEPRELLELVSAPQFGAVASFLGTVRSPNRGETVHYIDYQGYTAMIRTQMAEVVVELRERFDLGHVAVTHRLGRLLPGEASIAIFISSPHRRDALEATHACIDELKARLPVWKYEVGEDGSHWVEGVSSVSETL